MLEFDYMDRTGRDSRQTVEPYRLLLKGMRWYLDGYCLEREDFRLFKLTRMTGLALSGDRFVPGEYHPDATVKPQFQDREVITVELFLLEKPWTAFSTSSVFPVSAIHAKTVFGPPSPYQTGRWDTRCSWASGPNVSVWGRSRSERDLRNILRNWQCFIKPGNEPSPPHRGQQLVTLHRA